MIQYINLQMPGPLKDSTDFYYVTTMLIIDRHVGHVCVGLQGLFRKIIPLRLIFHPLGWHSNQSP